MSGGGEGHLDRVGVLSDAPVVGSHRLPSLVDLLRVHAVLGVQVLHLTIGEHPAWSLIL